MRLKRFSVRDICQIGAFTAMIAVLAQVSIPMPYGVPMTLQTLAIALSGVVLGAKKGTISVLTYVLLGGLGAPVFAGFAGGVGVLLGPAGGFILSFPLLAFLAGIGAAGPRKAGFAPWLGLGASANYLCGALYFSLVTGRGLKTAFLACVLPFLPADILKFTAAGLLEKKLKGALNL